MATVFLLFCSYGPIIHNYQAALTGKFYFGQSDYPLDMLGDLAYVEEGISGQTLASFNYSTLLGSHPSIVKIEYIAIGLAGRLLGISSLSAFLWGRLVISLAVLAAIYLVIRSVFTTSFLRVTSYLLVLFGAGIILPGAVNHFAGYDQQVFTRLTQAMPHYLLGAGATVVSLYFLARTLEAPKRTVFFYLSLLSGVVASLVYAPDTVLLISGFPLYILFDMLSSMVTSGRVRINLHRIGILFTYAGVTLIPILYVRYITTTAWSDIRTAHMETLFPFYIPFAEYFTVVGMTYVLSLIAVPSVLRKGKPFFLLLATWLVMHPVGEYFISPILHLNYFRYFLTPYYVAFGILATQGAVVASAWIRRRIPKIPERRAAVAIILFTLLTGIGTYISVWRMEYVCYCVAPPLDFAYPKKSVMDGIFALRQYTRPDDIVLSTYFAGTLIPAFAGNRVYVSWWYSLIDPPEAAVTDADLTAFYGEAMTSAEAHAFLKREHISYVFYSDQEQILTPGDKHLDYPFLVVKYDKDGTIIYNVP